MYLEIVMGLSLVFLANSIMLFGLSLSSESKIRFLISSWLGMIIKGKV